MCCVGLNVVCVYCFDLGTVCEKSVGLKVFGVCFGVCERYPGETTKCVCSGCGQSVCECCCFELVCLWGNCVYAETHKLSDSNEGQVRGWSNLEFAQTQTCIGYGKKH